MKSFLFSIIILTLLKSSNSWVQITRWSCNTTRIYIASTSCRLILNSRYSQAVDFGFVVGKKIDKAYADYKVFYRSGKTLEQWRKIFKIDRIDVRAFLDGVHSLPFLNSTLIFYKTLFPKLPLKFPILPGNFFAKNVTLINNPVSKLNMTFDEYKKNGHEVGMKLFDKISPTILPNGIYRHVIKFYVDKYDPTGFCLWWHTEINLRMNDENFK